MRRTLFTFLSAIALVATGVVGAIAVGGTGVVDPPPRIAFLANGVVPADALAAGGIAGQLGAPLFTTPATSLNDDARDGIVDYDPDLVIVLGGPVAVDDSVLTALSAATGLAITTTENPTDGIVRVAGGDRFATARAVAGLLAAYDRAYLPVDATALGAIDAATADMADDSDLLDGLDSTDLVTADGEITFSSRDIHQGAAGNSLTIQRYTNATFVFGGNEFVVVYPELPMELFGRRLEIVGVEYCFRTNGSSRISFLETTVVDFNDQAGGTIALVSSYDPSDDRCQRTDFTAPVGLTDDMMIASALGMADAPNFENRVEVERVTWFLRPATGPARATTSTDSMDSRTRAPD